MDGIIDVTILYMSLHECLNDMVGETGRGRLETAEEMVRVLKTLRADMQDYSDPETGFVFLVD